MHRRIHQSLAVGDAALLKRVRRGSAAEVFIRLCHTEVIAEFAVMNVILGVSLTPIRNFSCQRPNSKSSVHFLPRAHWWIAN